MTKTRQCERCSASYEYEPAMFGDREIFVPRFCDPCVTILRAEEQRDAERDRLGARRESWREMCPAAYRDTDPAHPGLSAEVREALWSWTPDSGRFVGLYGTTGKGKTRLSFLRLKELHMEGWHVAFISAKRLEKMIRWQFSRDITESGEAQVVLQQVRKCQVLLLDDLGKEKFTERVAGEFYDLVEYRTSNQRAMIWTANVGSGILKDRLGDEHGEATVRRLLEFSNLTKV